MQAFLRFEWKRFWKDIKNKTAGLLFIGLSVYMAVGVERHYEPVRSFDSEPIAATLQDADYFLGTKDPEMYQRSFMSFNALKETAEDLLVALEKEEYREAIALEEEYYRAMSARFEGQNPKYYIYGMNDSERIQLQVYDGIAYGQYSESLLESDLYLTQAILEGKTVGQSLARSWLGVMPVIGLIVGLVFAIDFFAKDAEHATIADAFPLSRYKKSWGRTLVVWVASLLTLIVGETFFVIVLSFFRDWGGIDLWVPGVINSLTVFSFLLQTHGLLLLALLILLRIGSWIGSLLQSSAVMVLLIPALLIPYFLDIGSNARFASAFSWFPLSFFQVGDVVSGFQNFWHSSVAFTFGQEALTLVIGLLLVELLVSFTFKKI